MKTSAMRFHIQWTYQSTRFCMKVVVGYNHSRVFYSSQKDNHHNEFNRIYHESFTVRNIRIYRYAKTWEKAPVKIDQLYAKRPPLEDFLDWRDDHVLHEIYWYGWFIDFYMEGDMCEFSCTIWLYYILDMQLTTCLTTCNLLILKV